MFGIGLPELIIIMVVALIIIGPKKLPDLARALGKGMAEFRKATQDIKESLDLDQDFEEAKEDLVDAIGDVNRPVEIEDLEASGTPKYQDYDEALEAYEKDKEEPPREEDLKEAKIPQYYDDVLETHERDHQEPPKEETMEEEAPEGDRDKNGA